LQIVRGDDVNKDWFQAQLRARGSSQAELARFLGKDPSALSLILAGKRRFQMPDAERIANYLQTPVEEVLSAAGIAVSKARIEEVRVKIVGICNGEMLVNMRPSTASMIEGHRDLPRDSVAIRMQTLGSSASYMDGWILFFSPANSIDPSMVNQMCVIEMTNGDRRIGQLQQGYQSYTYNVVLMGGGTLEDIEVKSANPITWIKT
jgi:transcriptional regulator with XRE-family HTH domain